MASVDFTTIIQAGEGVLATVITGVITIYGPRLIAALQTYTGVVLTENQRQTFLGAAKTAAGILETRLDQGLMGVEHINVTSAAVANQAQAVINAVPTAAAALGMTQAGTARMLIGLVDTAAHPGPASAAVQAPTPGPITPAPLKTWRADQVLAIPPVPKP